MLAFAGKNRKKEAVSSHTRNGFLLIQLSSSMALSIAGRYFSGQSCTLYFTRWHCSVSFCRSLGLKYFSAGRLHRWNSVPSAAYLGLLLLIRCSPDSGDRPRFSPQAPCGTSPAFPAPPSRRHQRFQSWGIVRLLPYNNHPAPLYSSSMVLGMMNKIIQRHFIVSIETQ